jgi:hypothetical protein
VRHTYREWKDRKTKRDTERGETVAIFEVSRETEKRGLVKGTLRLEMKQYNHRERGNIETGICEN